MYQSTIRRRLTHTLARAARRDSGGALAECEKAHFDRLCCCCAHGRHSRRCAPSRWTPIASANRAEACVRRLCNRILIGPNGIGSAVCEACENHSAFSYYSLFSYSFSASFLSSGESARERRNRLSSAGTLTNIASHTLDQRMNMR